MFIFPLTTMEEVVVFGDDLLQEKQIRPTSKRPQPGMGFRMILMRTGFYQYFLEKTKSIFVQK